MQGHVGAEGRQRPLPGSHPGLQGQVPAGPWTCVLSPHRSLVLASGLEPGTRRPVRTDLSPGGRGGPPPRPASSAPGRGSPRLPLAGPRPCTPVSRDGPLGGLCGGRLRPPAICPPPHVGAVAVAVTWVLVDRGSVPRRAWGRAGAEGRAFWPQGATAHHFCRLPGAGVGVTGDGVGVRAQGRGSSRTPRVGRVTRYLCEGAVTDEAAPGASSPNIRPTQHNRPLFPTTVPSTFPMFTHLFLALCQAFIYVILFSSYKTIMKERLQLLGHKHRNRNGKGSGSLPRSRVGRGRSVTWTHVSMRSPGSWCLEAHACRARTRLGVGVGVGAWGVPSGTETGSGGGRVGSPHPMTPSTLTPQQACLLPPPASCLPPTSQTVCRAPSLIVKHPPRNFGTD